MSEGNGPFPMAVTTEPRIEGDRWERSEMNSENDLRDLPVIQRRVIFGCRRLTMPPRAPLFRLRSSLWSLLRWRRSIRQCPYAFLGSGRSRVAASSDLGATLDGLLDGLLACGDFVGPRGSFITVRRGFSIGINDNGITIDAAPVRISVFG